MFRLNVKGSFAECLAEIDRRGLTAIGCIEFERRNSCAIDVESCQDYLNNWFNEPSECLDGIGFAPGTLLNATQHQNYTKPLAQLV